MYDRDLAYGDGFSSNTSVARPMAEAGLIVHIQKLARTVSPFCTAFVLKQRIRMSHAFGADVAVLMCQAFAKG